MPSAFCAHCNLKAVPSVEGAVMLLCISFLLLLPWTSGSKKEIKSEQGGCWPVQLCPPFLNDFSFPIIRKIIHWLEASNIKTQKELSFQEDTYGAQRRRVFYLKCKLNFLISQWHSLTGNVSYLLQDNKPLSQAVGSFQLHSWVRHGIQHLTVQSHLEQKWRLYW